ncbi:MAG TPA: LPXTG cell wall anchor domain-containing protein [Rhabdochlamydiaceae bacterium]|jgi:LPXTG-motif cell wall-anchored protein|nr:LPXTG cell wall anchor domain-containing protein [Rhabdochlamydiaceae bacterium]
MNHKRIVGSIASLAGIALIVYALHAMHLIAGAKAQVKTMSKQMSGNYVGKKLGSQMQANASAYDTRVQIGLYSGVALVVIGAGLVFTKKRKK